MTLLSWISDLAARRYAEVREEAARLAREALAPGPHPLPRSAVIHLLHRALHNGAWRTLSREQRALLLAAVKAPLTIYRSPLLVEALRSIWAEVEMSTIRGRAVYAALLHLLARGAKTLLARLLHRGLGTLLAIGIQLLNNPWLRLAQV